MYEILGYADNWTVTPGDTLAFKVSCDGVSAYDADLVRVRSGDTSPGAPGLKETVISAGVAKQVPGRKQVAQAGSFVRVEPYLEPVSASSRTWVLGIMPTFPEKGVRQTIFGRWDAGSRQGYVLGLNDKGQLFWETADAQGVKTLTVATPMVSKQWYAVVVSIDVAADRITLTQTPLSPQHALNSGDSVEKKGATPPAAVVNALPFFMGAELQGEAGKETILHAYNGRLDSLTLLPYAAGPKVGEALRVATADRRFEYPPLMAWDFGQRIESDIVVDTAVQDRKGHLFNFPSRGIPGMRWDTTVMRWTEKPDHFAALHFHADGLEDARWETDFTYRIPKDLPSGVYAMRLSGNGKTERIIFIVRPAAGAPRKKIAMLMSTATYMAYSNSHYRFDEAGMEMKSGSFMTLFPWETYLNEHRELGLSMYDLHEDGYGVYYASRKRPVFSMHLQCRTWSLNADTHMIDWLDEKGFEYDVISDDMLDIEGLDALQGYNVVMTGAHPEYWTTRMWQTMTAFQQHGGRLMYLGGNGFYWRCAYHPEKRWAMELRRTETGARYSETPAGESYHSYTGEYGGTWRRIGAAPQTLVGIGTTATGFDASSYYRRRQESHDPRAAFIFEGVNEEIIGDFGSGGGGAAGDEIDRADYRLGTPPHTLVLARSEKHTRYYNVVPEETSYHHPTINGEEAQFCYADLIFYECVGGGAVFSTGSITWGGSLAWNGYQNNVSRITENVLRRFADEKPFAFPKLTADQAPKA